MSAAHERVLRALEEHGCKRGKAYCCPAHDDRTPSLTVSQGEDGRVLVKCHAGCETEDVVTALGLTMTDLFEPKNEPVARRASRIVDTYSYTDENCTLLFEVCRLEPKGFRQRRPDGNGGWVSNLDKTRRVLFRLPYVLEAVKAGGIVYVAEGEKDVIAIEKTGAIATCNPGGAGKWRPDYSDVFTGARVRVIADNDGPGIRHARDVAESLMPRATSVALLRAAHGKDAFDHLAGGLTLDDLVPLDDDILGESTGTHDPDSPVQLHRSDMGNARLFARIHGQNVRFDRRWNQLLVWETHRWAEDRDGRLIRMAEGVAHSRFKDAWKIADKDEAKRAAKFAIDSENRAKIVAMLELAKSLPPIATIEEDWDGDPMLLGVPNGVVDLRTGQLRTGRRDDRITMQAGVAFDPQASCTRWIQFLHEVFGGDQKLMEFVRCAIGYSITGDVSEQILFLLYGDGANGKSTLLNAIRHALGAYGYNMPFSTVEMDRR
jgi:putative DNA primase/helicase